MLLDWSDRDHWNGGNVAPCRWCGFGCWTLDDARRPAHKSCVEARLPSEPTEQRAPQFMDLAAIISELGGKCPTCQCLICQCEVP